MKREINRGRGATMQIEGRFEQAVRESFDDGWRSGDEELPAPRTTVTLERTRHMLQKQDSPDLPFEQSLNPYRGCEHGCIYCYARPSHGYLNLSPGLDFETRLFAKPEAAARLREELAHPAYRCAPIALGVNTDCYQPVERKLGITRQILEVLVEYRHPVFIITKSALIERDLDLLATLAQDNLVQVSVSVTTLQASLARKLEPRAAAPQRRLQTIRALSKAGIPCGVSVAPVIPFLTDAELESVLKAAHAHGARTAGYTLLRLPYEVKELFQDWLAVHYPLKAEHVMSRLRDMRGGRENDSNFGTRFRGSGLFAQLLAQRFRIACKRLGLIFPPPPLDVTKFVRPRHVRQQTLF